MSPVGGFCAAPHFCPAPQNTAAKTNSTFSRGNPTQLSTRTCVAAGLLPPLGLPARRSSGALGPLGFQPPPAVLTGRGSLLTRLPAFRQAPHSSPNHPWPDHRPHRQHRLRPGAEVQSRRLFASFRRGPSSGTRLFGLSPPPPSSGTVPDLLVSPAREPLTTVNCSPIFSGVFSRQRPSPNVAKTELTPHGRVSSPVVVCTGERLPLATAPGKCSSSAESL